MSKEFIGEYIEKVFISEDKSEITFQTPSTCHYTFYTMGECCNEVFFNHCSGIENLIDSKILSFVNPGEIDEMGILKIKTNKGYCDFEIRNDCDSYPYFGEIVFRIGGGFDIGEMKLLTKDF